MTQQEAEQFVQQNRGGSLEESAGPWKIGAREIWEVWTYVGRKDEYFVRFASELPGRPREYDDGVNTLCRRVHAEFEAECQRLQNQVKDASDKLANLERQKAIEGKAWLVAGPCFAAVVAAVIYKFLRADVSGNVLAEIIGGIVAAGLALFYGVKQAPKLFGRRADTGNV